MIRKQSSFNTVLCFFFCVAFGLLALACGGGESGTDEGGGDTADLSDVVENLDSETGLGDTENVDAGGEDAGGEDAGEPPEDTVEPADIDETPEDIVAPPEDVEEDVEEDYKH